MCLEVPVYLLVNTMQSLIQVKASLIGKQFSSLSRYWSRNNVSGTGISNSTQNTFGYTSKSCSLIGLQFFFICHAIGQEIMCLVPVTLIVHTTLSVIQVKPALIGWQFSYLSRYWSRNNVSGTGISNSTHNVSVIQEKAALISW
jgi:hypothetical protein